MWRILWLVLIALLAWAQPAAPAPEAAAAVRFRSQATATGDYIFLEDLAELPPELAQRCGQVLVWTAPPPGQTYVLTREFLRYRLAQLGLEVFFQEAVLPPAIQVHQTGVLLSRKRIAEAFRRYILERTRWPADQVRLHLLPLEEPVILPEREATLEVLSSKNPRLGGEVTLEMALVSQGQIVRRFQVTGRILREAAVVCAARPLAAQAILRPGDLRLARRDITGLKSGDYFLSPDQVAGRLLSRPLNAGEMVTRHHLSQQPVIRRGDIVTVVLDDRGLEVTTKAVAREPGYPGRPIRMLNPRSKKEFQAQVVDARTVKVTL